MRSRKIIVSAIALFMVVGAMSAVPFVGTAQEDEEVVYIAMQQDMPNFNNFDLGSNTVWKDYVIGKFAFESLSSLDPEGNIFPNLAESWDFWETNLTVIVHLRPDVKFHDFDTSGEIMDADDVVFSYQALRDGTTLSSSVVDAFDADGDGVAQADEVDGTIDHDGDTVFEGVTRLNDTTVMMVMAKPYGQFFLATLGIAIIPEHIWSTHLDGQGRLDVTWSDDEDATIATGPFYYKEGEADVYRIMERFEDYWGRDETTPSGHRLFPATVKTIHYKLYSSLDTAILALKSRQVDHLPWTVTPGYVPDLTNDPNTDLKFVSDNGYFYLAFNQKREPMNYVAFREAVSYVIDKDTIVERYMGGYGQAGTSSEPPFWTDWYNSSVETYPFDDTLADSTAALAAGGFTGIGSTLTMPDGRPVPPLVLLTPPADYDPIRIKAGELIAKNLRDLGMNIIAKPLDFDALVAKMNAFDYDMLIIGWSLSSDPIGNVFDILGPMASQNYFAFWSTTNDNPFYNTLGGVSTKADAQTQLLADRVVYAGTQAKQTFDRAEQIMWTKYGQGLVSQAIPCNVLYYRVNVYAISTTFNVDKWINFLGELLNVYSMAELTPAGAAPSVGEQITAALSAPDKFMVGDTVDASVMILDSAGLPFPDADVTISVPPTVTTVTLSPSTGTSDASGMFAFTIQASEEAYVAISALAESGTNSFTDTKTVQSVAEVPNILHLTATPGEVFLRVTESTDIALYVQDGNGNDVEGATVSVDEGLVGYGSMTSASVTTDASGAATMTYNAPTDLSQAMNKHLDVRLSIVATKTGYVPGNTNTVTQFITVFNPTTSDWHFLEIQAVSDYAMEDAPPAGNNISTITVHAYDAAGANLGSEDISISYTNIGNLVDPVMSEVTNGGGIATFDVQFKDGIDTTATRISIKNDMIPNGVATGVTLLFKGATVPAVPIYGGVINYNTTQLLDPNTAGTLDGTVELYDIDGNPPVGITEVTLVVGQPALGSVATLDTTDPYLYSSLVDYAGIQLFTDGDGSAITSGGYFLSNLMSDAEIGVLNSGSGYPDWQALEDDWWTFVNRSMTAVNFTDGMGYFTLTYDGLVLGDSVPHVMVVPNGLMGFYVTSDFANFWWTLDGNTTIHSEFATERARSIISTTMSVDNPTMRSLGTGNTSAADAAIYDQDNNAVNGASVAFYVQAYGASPFFTADPAPDTGAAGTTTTTVYAHSEDTGKNPLFNPVRQPLYANPSLANYATIFASTEIFNIPIQLFLDLDVETRLEYSDPSTTVTATVTDESGNPMEDMNVIFSSDHGTLGAENGTTDASGVVSVTFDYAVANGFDIATVLAIVEPVQGYIAASSSVKVEGYNEPSTMTITPIDAEIDKDTVTIEGTVTDPEGVTTVQLILDGGTPVNVTVSAGAFSHEFTDLEEGPHTVTVRAIDGNGDETDTDVEFTVSLEEPTEFPWLWIIIAIIVIIVVILVIMMVMRSRAAPAAPEEEAPMEEEPMEELPSEEIEEEAPIVEEPMEESPMEETPSEEAESETLSEE
jgi:ABC-type transport system substrate-binding protein